VTNPVRLPFYLASMDEENIVTLHVITGHQTSQRHKWRTKQDGNHMSLL
jgi:hypothetical protein